MKPDQMQLKQNLLEAARNLRDFQIEEVRARRVLRTAHERASKARDAENEAQRELLDANQAIAFVGFGNQILYEEHEILSKEAGLACHNRKAAGQSFMLACVIGDNDAIVQAALTYSDRYTTDLIVTAASKRLSDAKDHAYHKMGVARAKQKAAEQTLDAASAEHEAAWQAIRALREVIRSRVPEAQRLNEAAQNAAFALTGAPQEQHVRYFELDIDVVLPGDERSQQQPTDTGAS